MVLAYLVKKFPRLSETFVLNEVLGQQSLGTPLHVFARRSPDNEPRQPQFAALAAPVELVPPAAQIDLWQDLFGPDGAALLPRVQGVVEEFRPLGHARLPSLVAEALWLRRRAAELGIHHVHVHFATEAAVTAMLLQALGGPTFSVTAHAKDIYRSTVNVPLLSAIVERSAFTVTVCDANVRHMADLLGPRAAARIRRLYNGVDLELFRPAREARRGRHVLCVGRLVEKKGLDVLIDAFALLARRGVPFTATLIGDGEERSRIHDRVEAAGLGDRVELAGALDSAEVRRRMGEAELLCLPCKIGEDGNRDALPTVLLEALASGLPCVSTPVTGIPEILDHGRAGTLVPVNDVEATARAMERVMADPRLRAEQAAAGRARAEQFFDARASARTLHGWFESVRAREEAPAA